MAEDENKDKQEAEKPPKENGSEKSEEAAGEDSGSKSETSGGRIEVEGKYGLIAETYAYEAVNKLGAVIANRAHIALREGDENNPVILVVNDMDYVPGEIAKLEIEQDIETFKELFTRLEGTEPPGLPPVNSVPISESGSDGGSGVNLFARTLALSAASKSLEDVLETANSVLDIVQRLRPSYKIAEREFSIDDVAIRTATAGKLARSPYKRRTFLSGFHPVNTSRIFTDIASLRNRVSALLAKGQTLATLIELCEKNGGFDVSNEENVQALSANLAFVEEVKAAGKLFQTACESWALVKDQRKTSMLEDALTSESMKTLKVTHILWLGILTTGGETMIKERRLRSDRSGFLGGAVVTYVLSTKDGEVLRSDVLPQIGASSGRLTRFFREFVVPSMGPRHGRED